MLRNAFANTEPYDFVISNFLKITGSNVKKTTSFYFVYNI